MSDNKAKITNDEILLVLGITGFDGMKDFFNAYLDTKNEIQALVRSGLTYKQLEEWKQGTEYTNNKKLIDDYHISLIEQMLIKDALGGSFKHQEMLLVNKDERYSKDKSKKGEEVESVDTMVTNLMGTVRGNNGTKD